MKYNNGLYYSVFYITDKSFGYKEYPNHFRSLEKAIKRIKTMIKDDSIEYISISENDYITDHFNHYGYITGVISTILLWEKDYPNDISAYSTESNNADDIKALFYKN